MAKIRFTSIKPNFVFEHKGVKLEAVEPERKRVSCIGCVIYEMDITNICSELPCDRSIAYPKQKHTLIFKKVKDEKEE